jgi:hypothetical protein
MMENRADYSIAIHYIILAESQISARLADGHSAIGST